MYDAKSLAALDRQYFTIICSDEYDVTLISKCTYNVLIRSCCGYQAEQSTISFHKHCIRRPYHEHGRATSLKRAIRQIKAHDAWQMAGRPEHLKSK